MPFGGKVAGNETCRAPTVVVHHAVVAIILILGLTAIALVAALLGAKCDLGHCVGCKVKLKDKESSWLEADCGQEGTVVRSINNAKLGVAAVGVGNAVGLLVVERRRVAVAVAQLHITWNQQPGSVAASGQCCLARQISNVLDAVELDHPLLGGSTNTQNRNLVVSLLARILLAGLAARIAAGLFDRLVTRHTFFGRVL